MYIYGKKGGNARHRPFMGAGVSFLYIKILVSGQENIIYEKTMKYHKEWIIGHDKKDYRNSQYFVFVFS